jgi:hypothetical protein
MSCMRVTMLSRCTTVFCDAQRVFLHAPRGVSNMYIRRFHQVKRQQ